MEEQDLTHFRSISWCGAILSDTSLTITPTFSRQPKPNSEDSLFAITFQTPSTISHCLSLHTQNTTDTNWISEVHTLMTLGVGMNGGPKMLHGGVIATLMDDVIGTLLTVNKHHKTGDPLSSSTVTAYMNVKYLKPVETPQTVLVVAKSREVPDVKGKKFFMDAEIRDGDGNVLAKADSLWIRLAKKEEAKL
jgi:acyl-coenzyme A thioesterase PaaI-like protein